jgi:hypothetical protein
LERAIHLVNTPVWTKWRKVPNSNPTRWKYVESNVQIHGSSDEWYTYTYSRPWDTTRGFSSSDRGGANTKVWGHNGPYKLQVLEVGEHTSTPPYASYNTGSLKWQKIPQSGPAQQMSLAFPDPFKVNVHNLVITDVMTSAGNNDYFKFDPNSNNSALSQPTINFTIKDQGDPHRYKWRVRVRSTDVDNSWANSILISGTADEPGAITAKINAPNAPGQTQVNDTTGSYSTNPTAYAPLTGWGTFTFDISVQEVDANDNNIEEPQSYRSQKLFIPALMPDGITRGHGGKLVKDANGVESYSVHYYFHDNSAPGLPAGTQVHSMKIEMLPPDMGAPIAGSSGSWGKVLEVGYNDKLLHTFAPQPRDLGGAFVEFKLAPSGSGPVPKRMVLRAGTNFESFCAQWSPNRSNVVQVIACHELRSLLNQLLGGNSKDYLNSFAVTTVVGAGGLTWIKETVVHEMGHQWDLKVPHEDGTQQVLDHGGVPYCIMSYADNLHDSHTEFDILCLKSIREAPDGL